MNRYFRTAAASTALLCALASSPAGAGENELDRAVERYYAGYPDQAIAMLEPLALAGDAEAQYLLGNVVYALAQSGLAPEDQDPSRWYRMAAERGSAEASYALGALYNNRWLANGAARDAELAEHFYQRAADLGYRKAEAPLLTLAMRNRPTRESDSRVYTNADFASTQDSPPPATPVPAEGKPENALADFTMTGDPIADAARLQALLARLGAVVGLPAGALAGENPPDRSTLIRILGGFGADEQLIGNVIELMEYVRSVTERDLAPGAD